MGIKTTHLLLCRGTISRPVGSFMSGGKFIGHAKTPDHSRLTNECMGVVKVINYLRMCQRSFSIPMGHSLYIQFNVSLACETA